MKESEFIQRAKKDDFKNNPGFEQSHNGVDSILPPTQHLQIRVSSNIGPFKVNQKWQFLGL